MIGYDGSDFPYSKFKGAKVCIVGGHDASIVEEWVSECDYLVCVNDHYKRQGLKPTVYFGGNMTEAIPDQPVSIACVNRGEHDQWYGKAHALYTFDRDRTVKPKPDPRDEWLNTYQHEINGNPLSGMIALRFFSLMPLARLRVCGMDFYHDANGDIIEYNWPHNVKHQSTWARRLWRQHMRLDYSPHLMGVLNLGGETKGCTFIDDPDYSWAAGWLAAVDYK